MDASLVLTLLQAILELLNTPNFQKIIPGWGCKSELEELKRTISNIIGVLNGVEEQERLQLSSNFPQATLDALEDAVYNADDLFDEIATLAQRQMLPGNKVSQDISLFFSSFHAFTKSREIRRFRESLDAIVKDHGDFGLVQGRQAPTLEVGDDSRRETYPSVMKYEIIGREEDLYIMLEMLLNGTTEEDTVSVVSIVGIGGMGKTTLAQLVYNDERINRAFETKMWVCVSHVFDLRLLLCKILTILDGTRFDDFTMEQLQRYIRHRLEGKKYLLVLDDLWNENRDKWLDLKKLLDIGARGSSIIVTTRSMAVARVVGSHRTHVLNGLSDLDSWKLFKMMTLESGQVQLEANLVEIGKVIVRKCHNVPFAIKVIGSLLRGQGEATWHHMQNTDLANIHNGEDGGIMSVLKVSYNYLPPHLKSCFNFCALYPKGYEIIKEDLINLWMAQGFIMPSDNRSFEDLGEEFFMILLERCFFQDVKQESGIIVSCNMHDYVHDLAEGVAGTGIKSSSDDISTSNEKTHHLYINGTIMRPKYVECYLPKMKRLRTCLGCRPYLICNYGWLPKMRFLRVLDMSQDYYGPKRNLKKLPSMIGQLVHLRYLDLSCNDELSKLPNSITQLFNLKTLKLCWCSSLIELPRELSKLINLRHLDLWGCNELRHMPPGMNKMTDLHKLTMFVVGGRNNASCCGSVSVGKLEDLKCLENLRDKIEIKMKEGWRYDAAEVEEGGYLINKPGLNHIEISWNCESCEDDAETLHDAEALLQGLQPHPNVKLLRLCNYPGVKFPSWGNGDSLMNLSRPLPNLVELRLSGFTSMEHVPLLSQLPNLKVLQLWNLRKVEYLESGDSLDGTPTISGNAQEFIFFPSLEKLVLCELPMLKGWWKASSHSGSGEGDMIVGFSRLADVFLRDCPELTTFPSLPRLENLRLMGSNKALGYFHSLSRESLQHLSSMSIQKDDKLETLSTLEVFRSGRLSSLRSLELRECSKFQSVSEREVWKHLTALETLALGDLKELVLEGNDDADVPWTFLTSLRSLKLDTLPKLVKLPGGMQHLTALRSLSITHCYKLEEIPTWISCFPSLQDLSIDWCPRVKSLPKEMRGLTSLAYLSLHGRSRVLEERCRKQTGADWRYIQHIPTIRP